MVAAIVLNGKMTVARQRQYGLCAPLVRPVGFVAQFMADRDTRAGSNARAPCQCQHRPPGRRCLHRRIHRDEKTAVEDRYRCKQQHPVVIVGGQRLDHRFGRVVVVLAKGGIKHGNGNIVEGQRHQRPDRIAAADHRKHGGHGNRRRQYRQYPEPAFGVPVFYGFAALVSGNEDHARSVSLRPYDAKVRDLRAPDLSAGPADSLLRVPDLQWCWREGRRQLPSR